MNLTIIVAISENNVIGSEEKTPWYLPDDLNRFKNLTLGHPVIMGRKTYESLPEKFRPLPDRKNIVLTSKVFHDRIYVARSISDALAFCGNEDSYVIGGGEIYRQFLPRVDRMEITRVHRNVEGDAFFPEVNWSEWKETFREPHGEYSFLTYERK